MRQVLIHDPTLRDGQHAVRHQLGAIALRRYAEAADAARIPMVEVGHGNGLGASSLQVGQAAVSDDEMLSTVRQALRHGLRGPLPAPGRHRADHRDGQGRRHRAGDLPRAQQPGHGRGQLGGRDRRRGRDHRRLRPRLRRRGGQHPARGAGAVLERSGFATGIDLYALLDAADLAERELMPAPPVTASMSIVSGLAGVFSGFKHRVVELSAPAGVDPRDVFFELGRRQAIAGQEDLIVDVVAELSARQPIR